MRFTLSWLREHLETDLGLDALLGTMGQLGLEIEDVTNPAAELAAFTTANVIAAEPHPDADKLRICTVETKDGLKQIVCGAPNARAGMTAIYAPLGAYIPGLDFALDKKPRKIRGVESSGMLCSTKELKAGEDHDGIADLQGSFPVGTPAVEALGLDDPVIDFEVTPNRPDWLGVYGIARDLAAAKAGVLKPFDAPKIPSTFPCPVKIETNTPQACAMFAGVVVKGVAAIASPDWLQKRLMSIGITPRNILVDVTNYVAFDRARPLHAYDLDTLQGGVCARLSQADEGFEALDGKAYTLTAGKCVIADDSGVIGLGGIMGGASTAVSDGTTQILLESAWFAPNLIARTGRETGINSDARYRFERGVDTTSCVNGLEMAADILRQVFPKAVFSEVVIAGAPPLAAHAHSVEFTPQDVQRLTGLDTAEQEVTRIVEALGFAVKSTGQTWQLDVPSWRFDVDQSADIVEEIARVVGFDALPIAPLPRLEGGAKLRITPQQNQDRQLRRVMAASGYFEAISWSFMHSELAAKLGALSPALFVGNSVTPELDYMRPSAIPNLAKALQNASDRGDRGGKLFELGPIYLDDTPTGQHRVLAGLVRPDPTRHWQGEAHTDSYTAKADCLSALESIGFSGDKFMIMEPVSALWHPGQAASLRQGPKKVIGHFGAMHPKFLKAMDVDGPLYGFEVDIDALPLPKTVTKTRKAWQRASLSPIYRDFAFVVDAETAAGAVQKAIEGVDKTLITSVNSFDIYTGKGVEDSKKSLAFEVCLRPQTQMTDADIVNVSEKIIANVAKKVGGVLR